MLWVPRSAKTRMTKMRSAILPLCILLLTVAAEATEKRGSQQVFRCEKDGKVVFSQVECGQDAKSVTVELQQPPPDKEYVAPYIKQQEDVTAYVNAEDKARKISRHEARIASLKKQLEREFNALKEIRFRDPQEKDKAIEVLSKKYNRLIKIEQDALKALHKQSAP